MKLIAYLSKKVKYCITKEHYLILDIIYNILIILTIFPVNILYLKYQYLLSNQKTKQ